MSNTKSFINDLQPYSAVLVGFIYHVLRFSYIEITQRRILLFSKKVQSNSPAKIRKRELLSYYDMK